MGRYISLGACFAVVCGLLTTAGAAARPASPSAGSLSDLVDDSEHVPGEVIVRYRPATSLQTRARVRERFATRVLQKLPVAGTELVKLDRGTSVAAAVAAYEADPAVLYAEPNYIYRASALTPNDVRFAEQWALDNTGQTGGRTDADIDAPEAWSVTTGSKDVVVAVVDTGVAYNHPDLAPNIWSNPGEVGKESNGVDDDANGFTDDSRGWDFFDNDATPRDLSGHGTHVAGTIGATGNDGKGIAGLNWRTSIMPLRALGPNGEGTTAQVAAAFAYARDNGADIVNASLGGPDFSLAVADAIATSPEVLFVVASGNEAANNDVTPSYPCNDPAPNIVCVAATDHNDELAGFSNYGALNVDLAAPGTLITSTTPPLVTLLDSGFDSGLSGWITGGIGTPWSRTSDADGGYAADSATGNYADNSNSWMQTISPVNLAGSENCRLSYFLRLATERDADGLYVEASENQVVWTKIAGWSGSTGDEWLSFSDDLTPVEGKSVYLRFRLVSNALVTAAGADVDEVTVKCLGATYSGNEYAASSGTSMATPHVAGAAALVLSAAPDLTVAALKAALLGGADRLDPLAGKVASGGRLNVYGALGVAAPGALPTPSASPSVTPRASSSPTPTPSVSPSDSPSPVPSPTSSPDTGTQDVSRSVSLRMRGHLIARGRVKGGSDVSCIAQVVVGITRNGRQFARTVTAGDGSFIVRLPDRPGRYRARVKAFTSSAGYCSGARSAGEIRHRH